MLLIYNDMKIPKCCAEFPILDYEQGFCLPLPERKLYRGRQKGVRRRVGKE